MADSSACPKCGAAVRPAQDWCTLCLHVLRSPEPPRVVAVPVPVSVASGHDETGPSHSLVDPDGDTGFDVEAAADALLGQLAVDTRRNSFSVPPFLNSKGRIAVFVTVAMAALCLASLATMGVLGLLFG